MKRVFIVVEGQTEQEFVNSIITPYLFRFGIYDVRPILIHTSRSGRGGMVNFEHLNNTVKMLLQSVKNDFIVTTFIDFFRLPHNMPKYDECIAVTDKNQELNMMENAVTDYICDRRFFAYIQKHEFEALLFSDNKGFEYYFPDECAKQTATIVSSYDSPEDINSTPSGAPSKRLAAIKPDYNKVLEGNLIAMEIGINVILERCSRFALWIKKIIDKAVI